LPEPDELPTIEANSPEQALDHLSLRRFTGEPGQTSAWLRVELDSADDSKRLTISRQITLVPVASDN
jgi:hypothetical protein